MSKPLTVRRPFRCRTCQRGWSVFAPVNALVQPLRCIFCGFVGVTAEQAVVLLLGGRERPFYR